MARPQVTWETPEPTMRTDPSPRATLIPATWKPWTRWGLQASPLAQVALWMVFAYLACGLAVGPPFVVLGAGRIDESARGASWGFRLAIIHGTPGPDRLDGTPASDVIYGGGGDDVIRAHAGNDALYGDGGNDVMWPGAGSDVQFGGRGDDVLHALANDNQEDVLDCGPGDDVAYVIVHDPARFRGCEQIIRLSPEEAAAYEKQVRARNDGDRRDVNPEADLATGYNDFWWDRGTKVVSTRRTSLAGGRWPGPGTTGAGTLPTGRAAVSPWPAGTRSSTRSASGRRATAAP